MKPQLEKLALEPKYSFVLQKDVYPHYPTPWHYHPEFELVLVIKSTGQRTVGDHTGNFSDGDLVLLGPNLPHVYRNDSDYFEQNEPLTAEAIVIHFKEDFLGKDFFNLPELVPVRQLFDKARFGMEILGETQKHVSALMHEMLTSSSLSRITKLLTILEILSASNEFHFLASHGFVDEFLVPGPDRITKVHEYIMTNFRKNISLIDVAEVANLSVPSFCRFFKTCTRKSFSHFLNEMRIGYACKLLQEGSYNISQVCYESGFNNITNFNRQFKKLKGQSPLRYKKATTSL